MRDIRFQVLSLVSGGHKSVPKSLCFGNKPQIVWLPNLARTFQHVAYVANLNHT